MKNWLAKNGLGIDESSLAILDDTIGMYSTISEARFKKILANLRRARKFVKENLK